MARKTKIVTVPEFPACDNRDFGKAFFIKEWDAARADDWMQRLAYAFNKGGGQIPMDVRSIGWEGIAIIGINTFLRGNADSPALIALGNELLDCVKIIRDKRFASEEHATEIIPESEDIAEVATRWWLRDQVVSVHTNFSPGAALWELLRTIMAKDPQAS